MKYVILIANTDAAQNLSPAEQQAWYADVMAWYEKGGGGSGRLVDSGHQLAAPSEGKTVRASGVTDGPFMETKEALGGYYLVEAADLDEALAIAKDVPAPNGGVEVRPIRVFG